MADLRPQMMLFVTEYLQNGNNATQAAIAAGYSEKTASSQGSRLLKSVEVQQYLNKTEQNLNKDLRMMFAEDAVKAYNVLLEIMESPNAMDKDRLVAARDLLDRAGYKPIDKLQADMNAEVSFKVALPEGFGGNADD
ncbi:phage terminase small subunit [Paenibacillus sp. 4624]|uniref:terminase small subunit n=1 Tax=Paenibacillus sp. 4624 TaxID=3156453 RepID=UPI003D231ED6